MKFRMVICPMCGRTAGRKRDFRQGSTWMKGAPYNFWERPFEQDKPFGVIMESTGRKPPQGVEPGEKTGTIHREAYFQPEQDGEFFHHVKARLLWVIRSWITKGWLTESEVAAAARGLIPPAETFIRNQAAAPKGQVKERPRKASPRT